MSFDEYQTMIESRIDSGLTDKGRETEALCGMNAEVGKINQDRLNTLFQVKNDELEEQLHINKLVRYVAEYCISKGWNMGNIVTR